MKHSVRRLARGIEEPHVLLGAVGTAIARLAEAIAPRRIWIMLDEWSTLPADLQPLVADLLRRTFVATAGVTVKIGAIERRSHFFEAREDRLAHFRRALLGPRQDPPRPVT